MKTILLYVLTGCICISSYAQQKQLDSLLLLLKQHPQEDTVRLNLLLNIATGYKHIDGKKGFIAASESIDLAKKLHNINLEATAYNYAAQNCQTLGNDSLAIYYCLLSNKIREQLKDSIGLAVNFHTMATSFYNRSNFDKAVKNEIKAEQIFKQQKDTFRFASSLNNLGVDYKYLGDYPHALKNFQQAFYLWNKIGNTKYIANPLNNTGLVYSSLQNDALALEYYTKALAYQKSNGDITGIINCYDNIASVYDDMNDTLRARLYYRKNLELAQKSNYTFGIASAIANLGISYLYANELDKAIYYLQSALKKFSNLHDEKDQAYIINKLCSAYLHAPDILLKKYNISFEKKWKYMLMLQQQSILLAKKIKSVEQLQNGYKSLSDIYEAKQNYKQALSAQKQYVIYKDSLVNDGTKQQITRLEMQYQFSKTEDSIQNINDKQQALAKAQIQKQRIVKNSTMAGAGFLILSGIGGFVFYKRNRDIRIQKNEVEFQSQIINTEMKALRAQMNPHFIFNSLNSIVDYINKNQTQTASDFTKKFAKLMRIVLENSEKKEIPLADDLKALEFYMQLESLKLKNKFTYEIEVDDAIDKDNTLVPPLILQPFVENSILHGIANKEGTGKITIIIKKDGDMINCIVEDNGTGLTKQSSQTEKTSLGMRITKARIDIINKLKNTNASMKLYNKEQGVRAEVKLPLELSF